jgi:hypothetical protein
MNMFYTYSLSDITEPFGSERVWIVIVMDLYNYVCVESAMTDDHQYSICLS